MARYDKYDPISGGFRARLAADTAAGDVGNVFGVGLDANGRVVHGSGATGVLGALVIDAPKSAGDVVDVMTDGEILDVGNLAVGTVYYADATGVLGVTNTDVRLGFTADDATRLVVRAAR